MRSPFENPAAFAPFYDSSVAVRGARANGVVVSGTFAACVLDEGYDEVFDESAGASSRVRKISVHIPKSGPRGWAYPFPPQVGDELTLASFVAPRSIGAPTCPVPGARASGLSPSFAVTDVALLFGGDAYVLEARQK